MLNFNQPMALRSILSPKYLEFALRDQYDMGQWEECLFWLRGLNDTYRVKRPLACTSFVYTVPRSGRKKSSRSCPCYLN